MRLQSRGIYLRPLKLDDARDLLALRVRNRAFLQPWEPAQSNDHFTLAWQTEVIEQAIANWESGAGYAFGIFHADTDDLIGRVNLSNVVRGAWESCTIGYFVDQSYTGRGYMTEAVRLAVRFAFEEAKLHRVQAEVMPRNQASIRVLEKVGFHYEGYAEYYLKINGVWEHHNIYSITREHWRETTHNDNSPREAMQRITFSRV